MTGVELSLCCPAHSIVQFKHATAASRYTLTDVQVP